MLCLAQGSDLLSAVKGGRVKEMEDLLKKGVNINCSDNVRRVCMYMYVCMYVCKVYMNVYISVYFFFATAESNSRTCRHLC